MEVPEHVSINNIQSSILGLLNQAFPHLHFSKIKSKSETESEEIVREIREKSKETNVRQASRVMNGAGKQNPPLAIDEQSLAVVRHIVAVR